jgi:hypothetical protein
MMGQTSDGQSRKGSTIVTDTMKIYALAAALAICVFVNVFQSAQVLIVLQRLPADIQTPLESSFSTMKLERADDGTVPLSRTTTTRQVNADLGLPAAPVLEGENVATEASATIEAPNAAVDPSESLSACLMVMDDNFRLPEWLAYNYFAMNLRHLVILSDPASRESPTKTLDPWREYITIEEWTEEDYFDKALRLRTLELKGVKNPSPDESHHNLLERQSKFIKSCSVHLQKQNRTWVSFHDIDEYYVINGDIVKGTKQRMEEPGSIIKLINELQEIGPSSLQSKSDLVLPEEYTGPCVTTYRVPYSAVESSEDERGQDVPSFLDPRQLETLRWRNHAHRMLTMIGKSLLDVSKLPALKHMGWSDRKFTPFSPHRLIPFCPSVGYHPNAFIVLNHYLGSWESYTYRANDSRQGNFKNRKEWEMSAYRNKGERGDDIRPWIKGFVRLFGEQKVQLLLGNAGLPADYTVSNKADASWQESNEFYLAQQQKLRNQLRKKG